MLTCTIEVTMKIELSNSRSSTCCSDREWEPTRRFAKIELKKELKAKMPKPYPKQ